MSAVTKDNVTRCEFQQYVALRDSGKYSMIPHAEEASAIFCASGYTFQTYLCITQNFDCLAGKFGLEEDNCNRQVSVKRASDKITATAENAATVNERQKNQKKEDGNAAFAVALQKVYCTLAGNTFGELLQEWKTNNSDLAIQLTDRQQYSRMLDDQLIAYDEQPELAEALCTLVDMCLKQHCTDLLSVHLCYNRTTEGEECFCSDHSLPATKYCKSCERWYGEVCWNDPRHSEICCPEACNEEEDDDE